MTLFLSAFIIFLLRLADQSLGTMRVLLVNKNKPGYAALIGLFESAIWIVAVSQVVKDINDPILIASYACGFAAGTILGSYIEKIVGLGDVVIKVFTSIEAPNIAENLRERGYAVTVINGEGRDGAVRICWCIIPRRKSKSVLAIIKNICPNAYITTELANPTSLKK
tara:strand:- start:492 stop:992 length:501 start_codon:yes stop_codon:yes gene_type:complete